MGACQEHETIEAVRQILKQLYGLSPPPRGINRIVRETIFFLYEGGDRGKWSVERPHSAEARARRNEAGSRNGRLNGRNFPVTYDHAIPLDTLSDGLCKATTSYEEMRDFLNRHVQGVVILRKENKKLSNCGMRRCLPAGSPSHDLLARYRKAEIKFEPEDEAKLKRETP